MLQAIQEVSSHFLGRKSEPFRRSLYDVIDINEKMIGIVGARGAGKTTLLQQLAKSKSDLKISRMLYLTCDHPVMAGAELWEIAKEFSGYGGKLLIIDEIHRAQDFSAHLKAIYDALDLTVWFSGSSALQIDYAGGDLSRRALIKDLPVMSFREFLELETGERFEPVSLESLLADHVDIAMAVKERIKPLEQFRKYLQYGAYPFYKNGLGGYPEKLAQVINQTIESDLSQIYRIKPDKLDALKKLLVVICRSEPFELNVTKLAAAIGVSRVTLYDYLRYLQTGSLIRIVQGAGAGVRKVARHDKLYPDNPNLMRVLCSAAKEGTIREVFAASMLDYKHTVYHAERADFLVDDRWHFEIGGPSKGSAQIADAEEGYLFVDAREVGFARTIPLWMLGMIY